MTSAQLINQTSGEVEYYTPPAIIEAARIALGGTIDLDPASSEKANGRVGAGRFFGAPMELIRGEIGGLPVVDRVGMGALDYPWMCDTLWMNHPFGNAEQACSDPCVKKVCPKRGYHIAQPMPGNSHWINHLIDQMAWGNIRRAAACITFASTSESWFQPLYRYPMCFLAPRTNYMLPDGSVKSGVTKGSVVTYLGSEVALFRIAFKRLGTIKV